MGLSFWYLPCWPSGNLMYCTWDSFCGDSDPEQPDDNHARPDVRVGRLTYVPDNESVRPSRPFPPASHSGEGPIVEAIGIPGGKNRVEDLEGMEQGTDPVAQKYSFLTVVAMKMYQLLPGLQPCGRVPRGVLHMAPCPGFSWDGGLTSMCYSGKSKSGAGTAWAV